jgi:hypothetical protein
LLPSVRSSSSHLLSIYGAAPLLLRLHAVRKAQRTSSKVTRHTSATTTTAILRNAAAATIAACTRSHTLLLLLFVFLVCSCKVHEQRLDEHLVLLHCSPRCCCLGWQVSQQCAVAR